MGEKVGFLDIVRDWFSYFASAVSGAVVTPVNEGIDVVMANVEIQLEKLQNRLISRLAALGILGLGLVFFALSVIFFMIEYLKWSYTMAFFSIAILLLVIGLLLRLGNKQPSA